MKDLTVTTQDPFPEAFFTFLREAMMSESACLRAQITSKPAAPPHQWLHKGRRVLSPHLGGRCHCIIIAGGKLQPLTPKQRRGILLSAACTTNLQPLYRDGRRLGEVGAAGAGEAALEFLSFDGTGGGGVQACIQTHGLYDQLAAR